MTIISGDCLDVLRGMDAESIDAIICDPPYGISYQSSWRTDKDDRFDVLEGDGLPFVWWLYDAFRVLKDGGSILVFCRWDVQQPFYDALRWAGFSVKSQIVWDRVAHGLGDLRAQFAPRHDIIWFGVKGKFEFSGKRPVSVLRHMRVSADKLAHPTEKPVDLLCALVEAVSRPGETILDPCAGSGSTLVAAISKGRKAIGIEIDAQYVKVARDRLDKISSQERLFVISEVAQ